VDRAPGFPGDPPIFPVACCSALFGVDRAMHHIRLWKHWNEILLRFSFFYLRLPNQAAASEPAPGEVARARKRPFSAAPAGPIQKFCARLLEIFDESTTAQVLNSSGTPAAKVEDGGEGGGRWGHRC
jgi:hypothetical protein